MGIEKRFFRVVASLVIRHSNSLDRADYVQSLASQSSAFACNKYRAFFWRALPLLPSLEFRKSSQSRRHMRCPAGACSVWQLPPYPLPPHRLTSFLLATWFNRKKDYFHFSLKGIIFCYLHKVTFLHIIANSSPVNPYKSVGRRTGKWKLTN